MKFKRFYLQFRVLFGVLLAGGMGTAVYAHYDTLHVYLSPGPLSAVNHGGDPVAGYDSHATFSQECTYCHAPIHCITDNKCQNCHIEIARQRTEMVGLHSRLPGTEKCQSCHVEHQGAEAIISEVPLSNIHHEELSGFSLAKHEVRFDSSPMVCEDCHTEGRFARDEVSCVACHEDADGELIAQHSTEHGENCLDCHDGTGTIIEFDHDTAYILQAGHETAGCIECHSDYLFAGTTQECAACHEEPEIHIGQFGQDCSRCHTAVAWVPAQLTQHRFVLNHGKEETLACNTCHMTAYTQVSCAGCHETADMQAAHPIEHVPDYLAEASCVACHHTGEPEDTTPLVAKDPVPSTD